MRNTKKTLAMVLCMVIVMAMGVPAWAIDSPQTVSQTPSTVYVNGTATQFEAYLIGGNNFFKLRDLAYALNGSNKQFSVGYDNVTRAITLTSGQPYVPEGGEMVKGDGTQKIAVLNAGINIAKDGAPVEITAYLIGGNNFMRLRDVMKLLDIGVGYDNETRNITLDTLISYTEDSGQTVTPPPTTPMPPVEDNLLQFSGTGDKVISGISPSFPLRKK